jgi:RNA polymerase sigma factor (TIGR02999 family)
MVSEPSTGGGRPVDSARDITMLLRQWRSGDDSAFEALLNELYNDLRRVAAAEMRSERSGHTLQPTAVVHDAVVRLLGAQIDWRDRAHFMAVMARTMRRVLVDHARSRRRAKRGGDAIQVTLSDAMAASGDRSADVVALDEALASFAAMDPRRAALLEYSYFGGLTLEEMAEVTGSSKSSVHRDLRVATAWLAQTLGANSG